MYWEWREWSLAALKNVEPHEVTQALTNGRMIRRWVDDHVLAVVSNTHTRRVLVVALYEDIESWVIIGAREASPSEAAAYWHAIEGGSPS
ncbi:MAG: hypothetical protein ACRDT6_07710 [Micromonosporaceae bacterium]